MVVRTLGCFWMYTYCMYSVAGISGLQSNSWVEQLLVWLVHPSLRDTDSTSIQDFRPQLALPMLWWWRNDYDQQRLGLVQRWFIMHTLHNSQRFFVSLSLCNAAGRVSCVSAVAEMKLINISSILLATAYFVRSPSLSFPSWRRADYLKRRGKWRGL
jgi:hypothetical protein